MTAWALDTVIGVTLLLLLVLAVRRPVAHCFGAGWAYALWLLPLLRIFMPPLDLFEGAVGSALPQYTLIVVPAAAAAGAAAAASPPAASLAGWLPLLLALWGGGAGVFAMWQQSAYSAFLLSLGSHCRPADPPSHGGVPVVESGAVDGPLAVGLLERRIVVPLDFADRYSPAERRLALDHELVHHRRGDIFWNYVALALLALTWFSPVSWIAFRAFRTDQELACDATVAAAAPAATRLDYALALVKSASRPGEVAACPLNRADQLKRRLKMIGRHRRSRARAIGGGAALALLLAFGMALSSPGFARQEEPALAGEPMVVAASGEVAPILDQGDVRTLAAKCDRAAPESRPRYRSQPERRPAAIVCSNGKALDDPEVRAIVARTLRRARGQTALNAATASDREQLAELAEDAAEARTEAGMEASEAEEEAREARAEAQEQVREAQEARAEAEERVREGRTAAARGDLGRRIALAEAAVQRSQAKLARIEARAAQREAGRALAQSRIRIVHAPMTPRQAAAIEAELERAREEVSRIQIDLDAEMDGLDAKIDRAVSALARVHTRS